MSDTIQNELNNRLKSAMKARNAEELNVIRAIRSKIGEAKTAKGFSGEVDDALHLKVIGAYVKSMKKAAIEFEKAGERGADKLAQLRFEVDYLTPFLPQKLGEAETRAIVEQVIADCGASSGNDIGRVMGMVMKSHKDQVDAGLVRSLADAILNN
jgi:uncharacterized protein YqeY